MLLTDGVSKVFWPPFARQNEIAHTWSVYSKGYEEQAKIVARASRSPAPGVTATVAPFRAWRSLRLTVAGKPTRTAAIIPRDAGLFQ